MNLVGLGQYLFDLQQPRFCIGPTVSVSVKDFIRVEFSSHGLTTNTLLEQCFNYSKLVSIVRIEISNKVFYNFMLIDNQRKEIERINPYIPELMDENLDLAISQAFQKGFSGFNYFPPASYCPLPPQDCYFLILYYLETRILNPNLTQKQILSYYTQLGPEQLLSIVSQYRLRVQPFLTSKPRASERRPISKPLLEIPLLIQPSPPSNVPRKGIIMCHGHVYDPFPLPSWLPADIQWTLVDISRDDNPDVLASYKNWEDLRTLGLFSWDYVLNQHCPAYGSLKDINEFIRAGRWLLRPGGQLAFPLLIPRLIKLSGRNIRIDQQLQELLLNNQFSNYQILNNEDVIFTI